VKDSDGRVGFLLDPSLFSDILIETGHHVRIEDKPKQTLVFVTADSDMSRLYFNADQAVSYESIWFLAKRLGAYKFAHLRSRLARKIHFIISVC
jgi:hypothetical protein